MTGLGGTCRLSRLMKEALDSIVTKSSHGRAVPSRANRRQGFERAYD